VRETSCGCGKDVRRRHGPYWYLRFEEFDRRTGLTRYGRVRVLVEKRNGAFFRLVKCTTNAPPCRAASSTVAASSCVLLSASLGAPMPSYDRALYALRSWLDSWAGIGHVTVGIARQGYDLQLTRYDEKGMEHSPTSATGTGWEAHAVVRDAADGAEGRY
jgi:hypothetical protein